MRYMNPRYLLTYLLPNSLGNISTAGKKYQCVSNIPREYGEAVHDLWADRESCLGKDRREINTSKQLMIPLAELRCRTGKSTTELDAKKGTQQNITRQVQIRPEADPIICEKGGPVSHFPFLSPSPLPYLSPSHPQELVLLKPIRRPGERCKLPQWGPGGAPSENEFCALLFCQTAAGGNHFEYFENYVLQ